MKPWIVEKKVGSDIQSILDDLANLRIKVFKEFPYLYDGTKEYEKKYLQTYLSSKNAFVVVIRFQGKIIGASTGIPLEEETEDVQNAFMKIGLNPKDFFYFGESVLLKEFRGQGIGHIFFEERENFAKELGYKKSCFCAVIRPIDHPLKPQDYKPLDEFWIKKGYKKEPNLVAEFSWKDIDKKEEDKKQLVFWLKNL